MYGKDEEEKTNDNYNNNKLSISYKMEIIDYQKEEKNSDKEDDIYTRWRQQLGEKDVAIFYWEGNPGHVALGTRQIYASFWPEEAARKRNKYRVKGKLNPEYVNDFIDENSQEAEMIIIPNLNVKEIEGKFKEFKDSVDSKEGYDWYLFSGSCSCSLLEDHNTQNCSGLVTKLLLIGGIQASIPGFREARLPVSVFIKKILSAPYFPLQILPLSSLYLIPDSYISPLKKMLIFFITGTPLFLGAELFKNKNSSRNKFSADHFRIVIFLATFNVPIIILLSYYPESADLNDPKYITPFIPVIFICTIIGYATAQLTRCLNRLCIGTSNLMRPIGVRRLAKYTRQWKSVTDKEKTVIWRLETGPYLFSIVFSFIFSMVSERIEYLKQDKAYTGEIKITGLLVTTALGAFLCWCFRVWSTHIHTLKGLMLKRKMAIYKDSFFSIKSAVLSIIGCSGGILGSSIILKNHLKSNYYIFAIGLSGISGFLLGQAIGYGISKILSSSAPKEVINKNHSPAENCSPIANASLISLFPTLISFVILATGISLIFVPKQNIPASTIGTISLAVGIISCLFACLHNCCYLYYTNLMINEKSRNKKAEIFLNIFNQSKSCEHYCLYLILLLIISTTLVSLKKPTSIMIEIMGIVLSIVGSLGIIRGIYSCFSSCKKFSEDTTRSIIQPLLSNQMQENNILDEDEKENNIHAQKNINILSNQILDKQENNINNPELLTIG